MSARTAVKRAVDALLRRQPTEPCGCPADGRNDVVHREAPGGASPLCDGTVPHMRKQADGSWL